MADILPDSAAAPASETVLPAAALRESDHMLVKAALLARNAVVSVPSLTRGFWKYYRRELLGMLERLVQEYRPHPALYLVLALAVFGGVALSQNYTLATGVRVNGVYVGAVENAGVLRQAQTFVQNAASRALGYDYTFSDETFRTYPVVVSDGAVISEDALVDEICQASTAVSYAYVLKVDGQAVASAESEEAVKAALRDKLNQYRTDNTISVEFSEPVQITRQIVSEDGVGLYDSVADALDATSQEKVVYTVRAGDTWSQISERYGMTSKELLALNPGYDMDKIWLDQELTVSAAVPLVSVKTVERVEYQDAIAYDTEWRDDASMYQGESRVITAGVNGVANVTANVSYVDGEETSRSVLSYTTVQEPVKRVVAVGTKEKPKTMASGRFSWPTSGRLSSTFGGRRSPGGIGSTNHKGIDIAGYRGKAIMAADGGTVSYAGWMSGYGYLVIIDHGNGYQTYYGHNSKLLVKPGTKVYKGQQIAKMGSTGNSTGNHCHFEIRLYGTAVNPLKYLP